MKFMRYLFSISLLVLIATVGLYSQVPPELIYPEQGDECVNKTLILEWTEVPSAVSYRVFVADNANMDNPIISLVDLEVTSAEVELPNWNTEYFWRAVSVFPNSNTGLATVVSFKTKLEPINLLLPNNLSICNESLITFSWEDTDAEFYHLQVAKDEDFEDIVYEKDNLTATEREVLLSDFSTTYYWRVASMTSLCKTEFSEAWELTTKLAPPILLSPENGAHGGNLFDNDTLFIVNLVWDTLDKDVKYNLQISKDENFDDLFLDVNLDNENIAEITLDTLFNDTYYWRVNVKDEDACTSYWSEVYNFSTPYKKPELAVPMNDETCVTMAQSLFKWSSVDGAGRYRLQISDTITFDNILIDTANISDREINLDLTNPVSVHYWRVKAEDSQNSGLWSEVYSFITTQKAPEIVHPVDGLIGLRKGIAFEWESYGESVLYDLKVYADSGLDEILLDSAGIDTNYFYFEVPNDNKVYYWKLRATFGVCNGDWSKINTFKTLIQSPTLLSPANNEIGVEIPPIYSWLEVEDADSYEIDIYLDEELTQKFYSEKYIKNTTWTYPPLNYTANTDYFWRVRAVNEDGVSEWSQVYKFTIDKAPLYPAILLEPLDFATKVSMDPVLVWTSVGGAESYIVTVSSDKYFNDIYLSQETADTTLELAGLDRYTSYWWNVKAVDENGKGTTSVSWTFRTEDIAPDEIAQLFNPADKAKEQPLIITFNWSKIERVLAYHLQISKDNTFSETSMFREYPSVPDSLRIVIDFEKDQTYYWRVAGWNEAGYTEWSSIREFTTITGASVRDNDNNIESHSLSPNPVKNMFNLNLNLVNSSISNLKICDLSGKVVYSMDNIELHSGFNTINIPIANLNSGFYFYYIESKFGTISDKFIVE